MSTYKSALDRLRELPPTFSLEQLVLLCDLDKRLAAKYASRWAEAGLIRMAGERTGFYANLVVAPQMRHENDWLVQALLNDYPTATIVGASVLNPAGWITQRSHQTQIAALAPARRARIEGFDVTPRSLGWYERTAPFAEPGAWGMRALRPAMALADMYTQPRAWHPDEDDLEIPEEDLAEVALAFSALGAEPPEHVAQMLRDVEVERLPERQRG